MYCIRQLPESVAPNQVQHLLAIPLCSIAAGELCRCCKFTTWQSKRDLRQSRRDLRQIKRNIGEVKCYLPPKGAYSGKDEA